VNASSIANERGIRLQEHKNPEETGAGDVISICVRTHSGEHKARGTVLHGRASRLMDLDGFDVEAPLEGHLLVLRNRDVPGVIGQVGTVLGQNTINIANFALGRSDASASTAMAGTSGASATARAEAMAVVQTDQPVSPAALADLKKIAAVTSVRAVQL
jgi:D-3-phosphoglycerate dehydrogenase